MGTEKTTIYTDRLCLRPFEESDLSAYAENMAEHEVGRWLPKHTGYTLEESDRMMHNFMRHWEVYGFGTWAVTDKETGELYGHCGLNTIKDLDKVEVLYALGARGRGKGYGTEAAKASVAYGFQSANLDEIIGLAMPDNQVSRGVLEKIGLRYIKDVDIFGQIGLAYYSIGRAEFLNL